MEWEAIEVSCLMLYKYKLNYSKAKNSTKQIEYYDKLEAIYT